MDVAADCVLASATDDAFAPAAAIALLSAAARSSERVACLVLDCGISATTKTALHRTFTANDVPFVCRSVDAAQFARLPLTDHFTLATYARLAVAHLAGDLASRTLYLDADTLALQSIDELVSADLNGCPAAAVQDPAIRFVSLPGGVAGWARLRLPPATAHFNAGVLLVDNEAWSAAKVSEHALELLRKYPHEATFADQGALNAVLAGAWMPLDARWNVPVPRSLAIRAFGHVISRHSCVQMQEMSILHFVGVAKPWEADYVPSPYRRAYAAAYQKLAPFFPSLTYWPVSRWARSRR